MSVSLQFVEPNCTLSPNSEMSQMEYSYFETSSLRYILSRYVERFIVEKFCDEIRVNWKTSALLGHRGLIASTKRQGTSLISAHSCLRGVRGIYDRTCVECLCRCFDCTVSFNNHILAFSRVVLLSVAVLSCNEW